MSTRSLLLIFCCQRNIYLERIVYSSHLCCNPLPVLSTSIHTSRIVTIAYLLTPLAHRLYAVFWFRVFLLHQSPRRRWLIYIYFLSIFLTTLVVMGNGCFIIHGPCHSVSSPCWDALARWLTGSPLAVVWSMRVALRMPMLGASPLCGRVLLWLWLYFLVYFALE